jgi:dienelactone hydrolase
MVLAVVAIAVGDAGASWTKGSFESAGRSVEEFHCVPSGPGAHPAVILLHGLSFPGAGNETFESMCTDLAAHGYFAEFIEFYGERGPANIGDPSRDRHFPFWMAEIHSGLDALDSNPAVDPKRVALVGFSLGSFLSLATGAQNPGRIAVIVEYYGALALPFHSGVANLPPTLIIHGGKDKLVPVTRAYALDEMLRKAGRPHEIHIYPEAEHGFNFPEMRRWYNPSAAQDAWNRTLEFLGKYLAPSK